jgi:hypothetical protein
MNRSKASLGNAVEQLCWAVLRGGTADVRGVGGEVKGATVEDEDGAVDKSEEEEDEGAERDEEEDEEDDNTAEEDRTVELTTAGRGWEVDGGMLATDENFNILPLPESETYKLFRPSTATWVGPFISGLEVVRFFMKTPLANTSITRLFSASAMKTLI